MDELDKIRTELARRRDAPGRAPMTIVRQEERRAWLEGYAAAMNDAANLVAREKWTRDADVSPAPSAALPE